MDAAGASRTRLAWVRAFPAAGGPVDVAVHRGEAVRLAGPNGAGKSSLIRMLAGLEGFLEPSAVGLGDQDPRRLDAQRLPGAVSVLLQDPHDTLVGLTVAGEFRLRGRAVAAGVAAWGHRDVAGLSSGEARRVGLAVAAGGAAPLLLLDEPTEGLDAAGRGVLRDVVVAWKRRGAVVFADHSGWLADLADVTVALGGPVEGEVFPSLPVPAGDAVVVAPAVTVLRGDRRLRLPAVHLGPGLHAVTGANGSGKTTLLRRLAGLEDGEEVQVGGAPVRPGVSARFLPARCRELFTRDSVALELAGCDDGVADRLVPRGLRCRHPLALSGGEAQRVALAKALGRPAPLYLLDEPEAHLDAEGRRAFFAALGLRVATGACVVAATHDAGLQGAAAGVVEVDAA